MNILIVEDYNWHGKKKNLFFFGCCAKYVCLWKSKRNDHLKTQEKEKKAQKKSININGKRRGHKKYKNIKKSRRIYEGI